MPTNIDLQPDGMYPLDLYARSYHATIEGWFGAQQDYQPHGALVHSYYFVGRGDCLGL